MYTADYGQTPKLVVPSGLLPILSDSVYRITETVTSLPGLREKVLLAELIVETGAIRLLQDGRSPDWSADPKLGRLIQAGDPPLLLASFTAKSYKNNTGTLTGVSVVARDVSNPKLLSFTGVNTALKVGDYLKVTDSSTGYDVFTQVTNIVIVPATSMAVTVDAYLDASVDGAKRVLADTGYSSDNLAMVRVSCDTGATADVHLTYYGGNL